MSTQKSIQSLFSLRRLILSWLFAVTTEYLLIPTFLRDLNGLDCLAQMSLPRVIKIAIIAFLLLWISGLLCRTDQWERWGMTAVFGILSTTAIQASPTWPFFVICLTIFTLLVVYSILGWDSSYTVASKPDIRKSEAKKLELQKTEFKKSATMKAKTRKLESSSRVPIGITVMLAMFFFLFVTAWTVGRVYSFHSPTYDFGIFSQMFYHLKESGLPMTTLERDGLLSHFAVHVSPIFYLLLPFYAVFPTPATLQILQSAVLTTAVIPLWKLGARHGLSPVSRMLLCALLLFYPAYAGGTSYDIHENCFLTPLILWLFYGLDRRSSFITVIAGILTLMVKEDAAVYVAVIGLWMTVTTLLHTKTQVLPDSGSKSSPLSEALHNHAYVWDLLHGILLLTAALIWFLCVTRYLSTYGDGVMTYRYKNFLYDGSSSLFTVVKATLLQPMKILYECVDPEKLSFIGLTLLPLLGLPLLTRRYERYLLLIPCVLMNLMSDYTYQHSIFFQYTFGSTSFLLYLTMINLADFNKEKQRIVPLSAALTVSLFCFGFVVFPKAAAYPAEAIRQYDTYQNIREILEQIPEDASVTATTFYTTWLSQRDTIYDINYCSREHLLSSEYIVLNRFSKNSYKRYATTGKGNGLDDLTRLLEDHGYTLYQTLDPFVAIYHKQP